MVGAVVSCSLNGVQGRRGCLMKSRRRIDWSLSEQQEGPCGWHQSVCSHCDDEQMHPLLAARTHRRVGSNGWRTACWCRVDFTQGRSKPRSRCWVRWHGQAREASGATDAEAKRLGRCKSESASFYASLIKRKRKITLTLRLSLAYVTLHMIASNRLYLLSKTILAGPSIKIELS